MKGILLAIGVIIGISLTLIVKKLNITISFDLSNSLILLLTVIIAYYLDRNRKLRELARPIFNEDSAVLMASLKNAMSYAEDSKENFDRISDESGSVLAPIQKSISDHLNKFQDHYIYKKIDTNTKKKLVSDISLFVAIFTSPKSYAHHASWVQELKNSFDSVSDQLTKLAIYLAR